MFDAGSTGFMLVCAMLVLLMTPGLAFFYGGLSRRKNVVNTMIMSFAVIGIVGVTWTVCGWSFAYGGDGSIPFFGGFDQIGLQGLVAGIVSEAPEALSHDAYPAMADVVFQLAFCMITTAIITGASSGLGREFARQLTDIFPEIECCWLIARREDRLEEIAREMVGVETVCLPLDLCDSMSFTTLQEKLAAEKPEVAILINNAGCGYLGRMGETETAVQTRMVDLNVRAMTAMTNLVIPYMPAGGRILNTSSIASFCPTPRMTVYGASKAYVSSFTVGLSEELKRRDITVTAVCPGPMKTEFLDVGSITGRSPAFEYLPYCDQVRVAAGALRAAKAGRTMYTPRLFYKFYRLLAKVTPVKLMVKFTKTRNVMEL